MSANESLHDAKTAKKDEFYTQMSDITAELSHYRELFRDKTVYCNCDDPYESNFFKYFALCFKTLGLKRLIATSYADSIIAGTQLSLFETENGENITRKTPYLANITGVLDINGDQAVNHEDIEIIMQKVPKAVQKLEGNGDFRSPECVELLKQADIVVTNPPFSLFREYVAQLMEYGKKFLILGNMNAITYKEIFPLIKEGKMWYGVSISSGDRAFYVPDDYELNAAGCGIDEDGRRFIRIKGVRWFTNLEHYKRHEPLFLYREYNEKDYPKYDNYDAINVDKTEYIPKDYFGVMGVPITFLDKYCPEQFEILGIDRYIEDNPRYGHRFTINGKEIYARILIRRKQQP